MASRADRAGLSPSAAAVLASRGAATAVIGAGTTVIITTGHHRRFRGYAFYGLPYVYAYSAYDGYGCSYLRRRAISTGSSYWWRRYEECRSGYEY